MSEQENPSELLHRAAQFSRSWLFDCALPLWWIRGADHTGGGFHEQLGRDANPIGTPWRLRVQARQIFVYARAGGLGWTGPWQEAVAHGLEFMLSRYLRADGFFRSTPSDEGVDLYDQAFVLFALAHAHTARPQDPRPLEIALTLMRQIDTHLRVDQSPGGYRATLAASQGMHANPHMHLLEALLAWIERGAGTPFRAQAEQICELALTCMMNRTQGALSEHFGDGWQVPEPQAQRYEPGHQFEWAYLFIRSSELLGLPTQAQVLALERFASTHGIDTERGVAVFSTDLHGRVLDRRARLWAQTERLRTYTRLLTKGLGDSRHHAEQLQASLDTVRRFVDVPTPGLWHEWMQPGGEFDSTPCPASSLYHLMTGLAEPLETAPCTNAPSPSVASLSRFSAPSSPA